MQIANTERPNNDWLSALSVCPGVCICGCALAQLGGVFTVSSARTGVNNKQTNPPSPPTTPPTRAQTAPILPWKHHHQGKHITSPSQPQVKAWYPQAPWAVTEHYRIWFDRTELV